jgi:hypothetical protein
MSGADLPDFHIPHAEKIEWMIETNGWALEAVTPRSDLDPPVPAHAYTIGLPAAVGFPEIALYGLTPAAANGLLSMVVDALRGGTDITIGDELIGLLDNGLRCRFVPVVAEEAATRFPTAVAWYRGELPDVVQLLYPDRNGFMPYETGFDQRMRLAQPVVGTLS